MRRILQLHKAIVLLIIIISSVSFAQSQTATIKGVVSDERGPLAGASVTVGNKGTTTNESGAYELKVNPGRHTVSYTYAGFRLYTTQVNVSANETESVNATLVSAGAGEEIVLVGTRATGRSNLNTPVPVDVIPLATMINEIGQVDLNQILNYIAPSFQSSRQTIADGTDHLDPAQLRGLGTDQVLVLINGKRRHQSALVNVNGTVNRGQVSTDLSAIPASAIERVEILRDGAAAQYGSDAIAGVINIVLKKSTGVLQADVSYGQHITEYDKNFALFKQENKTDDPSVKVRDGGTVKASVGYGFNLGKGYLNLTGEYINREATNRTGTYTGRVYPNVSGQNRDDSIMTARGQTRNFFDLRMGNSAMKSAGVFYNFGYPMGGSSELYLFGGYNKKNGEAAGFYRYPNGIPGAARVYAPQVFALYPNGFLPEIHSEIMDFSTAVGFRTKLKQWNFDISNTYGTNKFDFNIENSANYSQFSVAGNTQTEFDAGGLKFWQNTSNADLSRKYNVLEGLNIATGLEYRVEGFGIRSGEEASYKNYDVASGAAQGSQVFPGFINTLGDDKTRNAKAVYLDVEQDVTKDFLVTGAIRYEDYSDFGSTFNYKLATRIDLFKGFSLRGSVSTGFRAPSMSQRFYAKTNTLFVSQGGNLVPVESGTFTNDSKAAEILGIPKLKEETSRNVAAGVTIKPFTGFELSVDAYQIDIDNRIVLTNNFGGGTNAQLQQQLDAAGARTANFFTNAIDTRARGLETVASYNAKFAGKHSLRTIFAMTFIDNEVKRDKNGNLIIHASPILEASGQIGNYYNREDESRVEIANPKNKFSLTFNYKYSKFGAMLRFVRFGEVTYLDPTPTFPATHPINVFTGNRESLDQRFSAKTVTDISVSYKLTKQLRATVGANNLFDIYPDMNSHSSNASLGRFIYSRRVQQMGFNGAYYFGRLSLDLDTKK